MCYCRKKDHDARLMILADPDSDKKPAKDAVEGTVLEEDFEVSMCSPRHVTFLFVSYRGMRRHVSSSQGLSQTRHMLQLHTRKGMAHRLQKSPYSTYSTHIP